MIVLPDEHNHSTSLGCDVTAVAVGCSTVSLLLGVAAAAAVFYVVIKRRTSHSHTGNLHHHRRLEV